MSTDPWRRILVHVDADGRAAERLRLAGRIAAAHGASLDVVYACSPATVLVPLPEGALLSERVPQLDEARRAQARSAFDAWAPGARDARWEELVTFDLGHALARRVVGADLVILGQAMLEPSLRASVPPGLPEEVLLHGGRAALVLPAVGDLPDPDIAVVAWKTSPPCVRAVTAALPLLQQARRVALLAFGGERVDCDLAVAYLDAHGVHAEVQHEPAEPPDVGQMVLSRLADLGAGLLVMGCYGHGRARERVFGGMTRTILRSMTAPVLMAN